MTQKGKYSVLFVALVFSVSLFASVMVSAADSDLDPTFDGDGIVTTDHDEYEQINDIVIQPDGKILAAGHSGILHDTIQQPLRMMVARYNIDGSLDATFGSGGIVTTDIGEYARAWGIALQADGKIVVAGRGGTIFQSSFTVVRYNPNGSLDPTFGSGGIVTTVIGSFAQITDVVIQSDGKIVAAGEATAQGAPFVTIVATLARYNTDGSLDATFDGDGVSQPIPAGFAVSPILTPWGVTLQVDQKIVIAGGCGLDSTLKFCVSRYNSGGSLDNTFDSDGLVATDFDSSSGGNAKGISIQPDGKIVAAGQSFSPSGVIPALARYNTDGSLDSSFDSDGRVTTPNSLQFEAEKLALQSDGKMVVVGRGFVADPVFHSVMVVARYDSDGSMDETFGSGGITTTSVGTVHSAASAVAIQADGRIVVGGYGNFTSGLEATFSDFALVRYGMAVNESAIVSGGGWIDSPQGAFVLMPNAKGKASFSFVSMNKNGASVPTGNTRFKFDAGDLNFQSTSYESLVVFGNKAQFKGVGTINGSGSYRFTLTCIDGDLPGGGQDKLRMRISSDSTGLIYDNQLNAPESADPATELGGGNIVIHH